MRLESISGGPPRFRGDADRSNDFTAFYRRELAGQVRRAAVIIRSAEMANDIVHDGFVEVFDRWASLREPGPYLNRAVLNGCRDALRRRKVSDRRGALLIVDSDYVEDEPLFDVLATLPFNQRASIVLRFYAGMTEKEIADALDVKEGSVGPWISRALTTLRKALT